jgi:AcrR family transcriptional regulator
MGVEQPHVGGRERKKAQTRRDLANAARRLTTEHGLDAVTIQQIVEAADVSTRTFFNYFRCKEEAVVGFDPALVAELADVVRERPAQEAPLVALTEALLANAADPEIAEGWVRRTELVAEHPTLLPRHLAAMAEVEEALAAAVADRLGTSADDDLLPRVLVASTVAAMRSTFTWWMRSTRGTPLDAALASSFAALGSGFATSLTHFPDRTDAR